MPSLYWTKYHGLPETDPARAMNSFTLALVQMRCDSNIDGNFDKAVSGIRQASRAGAHLVCLQELFRSPYFCQRQEPELFNLAEPIPGPSTERLGKLAKESGLVIVAS